MKALFVSAVVLMCILVSCGPRAGREKIQPPEPVAEQVWDYIKESQGWRPYPEGAELLRSNSPHGDFLKLFVNQDVYKAVKREGPIPQGAMLVQENYEFDGKNLQSITLMYKIEGYNPDYGDWYWAKYDPSGNPVVAGRVNSCIQCHRLLGSNYIIPGFWQFSE